MACVSENSGDDGRYLNSDHPGWSPSCYPLYQGLSNASRICSRRSSFSLIREELFETWKPRDFFPFACSMKGNFAIRKSISNGNANALSTLCIWCRRASFHIYLSSRVHWLLFFFFLPTCSALRLTSQTAQVGFFVNGRESTRHKGCARSSRWPQRLSVYD